MNGVITSVDSIAARLLDLLVDMETLPHLLHGICELAVEAVPDCATASITLIRPGTPVTAAAFDDRARQIDEAQYHDREGPGLRAARLDADTVVQLDPVPTDPRIGPGATGDEVRPAGTWRQVGRDHGITAVASMPIPATADLRAALNLYTDRAGGWTPSALSVADALVTYAGDALTVGLRLDPLPAAPAR